MAIESEFGRGISLKINKSGRLDFRQRCIIITINKTHTFNLVSQAQKTLPSRYVIASSIRLSNARKQTAASRVKVTRRRVKSVEGAPIRNAIEVEFVAAS